MTLVLISFVRSYSLLRVCPLAFQAMASIVGNVVELAGELAELGRSELGVQSGKIFDHDQGPAIVRR
jgi:hypothetical protein